MLSSLRWKKIMFSITSKWEVLIQDFWKWTVFWPCNLKLGYRTYIGGGWGCILSSFGCIWSQISWFLNFWSSRNSFFLDRVQFDRHVRCWQWTYDAIRCLKHRFIMLLRTGSLTGSELVDRLLGLKMVILKSRKIIYFWQSIVPIYIREKAKYSLFDILISFWHS